MAKTVLITGCSSGFGLSMTKMLLAEGWQVIATVRNLATCDELKKCQQAALTILKLDVTIAADRQAIQHYISQNLRGHLDCLINNAGYGLLGPVEEISEPQIRQQMEVNVLGVILLTQTCLPALRQARGRIINISSALGYFPLPMQALYVTSKFALEGFSESLYYELAPQGVQVALIEPGAFKTRFGANALEPLPQNAISIYEQQKINFARMREKLLKRDNNSPEKLNRYVLYLLNKPKMPVRIRAGWDAHLIYWLQYLIPARLFQRLMTAYYQRVLFASS